MESRTLSRDVVIVGGGLAGTSAALDLSGAGAQEGAVRSGRLAAGALMGERERFLAAELPASGLMPLLVR